MNAVILKYRGGSDNSFIEVEHRCGKNAGYEFGPCTTYDIQSPTRPAYIRIWGHQGTFIALTRSLISLSFQENLDECSVCS